MMARDRKIAQAESLPGRWVSESQAPLSTPADGAGKFPFASRFPVAFAKTSK